MTNTITPGRQRYAITVEFELEDGAKAEFLQLIHSNAAESVRSESGCLRFDVLTPAADENEARVFLYEIYTDRAAFDLHLASPHFKLFDQRSASLVRKKEVRGYAVVETTKLLGRWRLS